MICTKCHKNEAEWFGLFSDDLCQECWEDWCDATWRASCGGLVETPEYQKLIKGNHKE